MSLVAIGVSSSRQSTHGPQQADGAGSAEEVLPGEKAFANGADWSRDGRYLLYQIRRGSPDIDVLSLDADRKRLTFAGSPATEASPAT